MREGTTSRVMAADRLYGEFYNFLDQPMYNVNDSMVSNSPERIAIVGHVGRTPLVVAVLLTQHILLQLLVELHSPQPNCTHVE